MRLIHWSDRPVTVLAERIACGQMEDGEMKPRGFWVSDEDAEVSWRTWCIEEDFRLDALTHMHEVTLSNTANICFLRSADEIRAFGRKFVMRHGIYAGGSISGGMIMMLDWMQVIQRYDGLIITPYQWECRLENDCFWYYGWDCASGCIWAPGAIGSVILREVMPQPKPASRWGDDEINRDDGEKPVDG